MSVRMHGRMRCHASRRNLSGNNISLFSFFLIRKAEIFSSVDEAHYQAEERCRTVVPLIPRKLLLMTGKQRRLLMLLLMTVK